MKALQEVVNAPAVQVMVDGIRPLPDDRYVFVPVHPGQLPF